jgi:hypothetical protein
VHTAAGILLSFRLCRQAVRMCQNVRKLQKGAFLNLTAAQIA